MNPLDLLRGLGRATGGGTALDPMLKTSNFITTQLRKAGLIPSTGIKEEYGGRTLNAIDYGKYGPTDWNPSANPLRAPSDPVLPPPTGGAADRAYQSAKAETAAMVATDPLMQQWSAAQKAKDFTTADQLGKQIWQNKYGKTPMGRPGGAIGSFNPLMQSTFGYQTGMSPGDIAKTITNPSDIPISPGEAPYQTGDLGTRATAETGYDPGAYGISPEMIEEMKKRLLQQSVK
jgi:hypothetical protein